MGVTLYHLDLAELCCFCEPLTNGLAMPQPVVLSFPFEPCGGLGSRSSNEAPEAPTIASKRPGPLGGGDSCWFHVVACLILTPRRRPPRVRDALETWSWMTGHASRPVPWASSPARTRHREGGLLGLSNSQHPGSSTAIKGTML